MSCIKLNETFYRPGPVYYCHSLAEHLEDMLASVRQLHTTDSVQCNNATYLITSNKNTHKLAGTGSQFIY